MVTVPTSWMPDCEMNYIVLHWTAGGYQASATDKQHYHILVQGDGTLVRGDHTIDDNVKTGDDDYAAHTRRFNTKAIGVSACSMASAMESPFDPGPCPMKELQWNTMAEVTAILAKRYNIPVTRTYVLGHGEVQRVHGVAQAGKWDPLVLPWNPGLGKVAVGNAFRAKVLEFMG